MAKRNKKEQTCHDESVLRRARGLQINGWNVKADIRGFKKPQILNGSRPDIDATKGKQRRIIEVETQSSKTKDRAQQKNLRKYSRSKKQTQFMVRTCRF